MTVEEIEKVLSAFDTEKEVELWIDCKYVPIQGIELLNDPRDNKLHLVLVPDWNKSREMSVNKNNFKKE